MLTVTDQTGQTVALENFPPRRIVSLVPSQTEMLHHLGLEAEVGGITKFCVHPRSWFETKPRVGGTKSVHADVVQSLNPDLIIANKEENVREQVEELKTIAPVWVSDIANFNEALDMIKQVGLLVNKQQEADKLIQQITGNFSKLNPPATHPLIQANHPKVAYLIWRNPYMTVGGDTFIGDMLNRCGFVNVYENERRYPQITLNQLASLNCDYIFLSSEPFPFKEQHAEEIRNQLPGIKLVYVDGEMFSWYGSRLLMAAQYFSELKERLGMMDTNTLA